MYSLNAINFGLLYWSFSIALNIVVTSLIVSRLLYMRHRLLSAGSSIAKSHAAVYTNISAMMVESAGLYSAAAIVFLVAYGLQSPVQYAVEAVEIIQVGVYLLCLCDPFLDQAASLMYRESVH
jgi:hypothetical protein